MAEGSLQAWSAGERVLVTPEAARAALVALTVAVAILASVGTAANVDGGYAQPVVARKQRQAFKGRANSAIRAKRAPTAVDDSSWKRDPMECEDLLVHGHRCIGVVIAFIALAVGTAPCSS